MEEGQNQGNDNPIASSKANKYQGTACGGTTTTTTTSTTTHHHPNDVQAARRGLLKAIWQTSVAPRFSSKPIDMEDYFSDRNSIFNSSINSAASGESNTRNDASDVRPADQFRSSFHESSNLTRSERDYLEELLKSDDLESIRRASVRLADKEIFPTTVEEEEEEEEEGEEEEKIHGTSGGSIDADGAASSSSRKSVITRRNSLVQKQLFEFHAKATLMPSALLKRMSSTSRKTSKPLLISQSNSLTQDDDEEEDVDDDGEVNSVARHDEEEKSSKDTTQTDSNKEDAAKLGVDGRKKKRNTMEDLNSWIHGNEGVEVDDEGTPEMLSPTSNPFKILGTSADDTSCHPHVLTPPLMEALLLFMPESLQEQHYWLKYSLVRDGPGLMKMLRHCRASQHTVLAIETIEGHVFGAFTSQPWRLISRGYCGSKESFVWRMRSSRNDTTDKSMMEQILMESQIDVFPFTGRNNMVQICTKESITLGNCEVKDVTIGNNKQQKSDDDEVKMNGNDTTSLNEKYYGNAIRLEKNLLSGFCSSSETFGNPCLIQRESRGETFEVANVELWSLTPHETVEKADQFEMKLLFLEEHQQNPNKNLNLIEILVGGTHV